MKRIMLVVLLAMLAIANVAAVAIVSPEALTETKTVDLPVYLDLTPSEEGENSIDVGFSTANKLDTTIVGGNVDPTEATSMTLVNENNVGTLGTQELYLYWILKTANPLDIKMYIPAALDEEEGDGTIDWTVAWNENIDFGVDKGSIGGKGNYGDTTAVTVFDFTGGDTYGASGAIPLSITTDNLEGATAGKYSGKITLLVVPDGV